MNTTKDIRVTCKTLLLGIMSCLILAVPSKADLIGDAIDGDAVKTNTGEVIFANNNVVGPPTEFMNFAFQGLAYFMDVDGAPFKKVKLTVSNGDPVAPQATVDTQWIVGDLDCGLDGDGNPIPVAVTALIPLPGNTLIVTEAIPLGGDGFRIRTASGQGILPGSSLCAEFAIVTANDIPGDVNEDGEVNLLDVGPFINHISTGEYKVQADVNLDGRVNLLDIAPFIGLF